MEAGANIASSSPLAPTCFTPTHPHSSHFAGASLNGEDSLHDSNFNSDNNVVDSHLPRNVADMDFEYNPTLRHDLDKSQQDHIDHLIVGYIAFFL